MEWISTWSFYFNKRDISLSDIILNGLCILALHKKNVGKEDGAVTSIKQSAD